MRMCELFPLPSGPSRVMKIPFFMMVRHYTLGCYNRRVKRFFLFFTILGMVGCATSPEKKPKPEDISPAAHSGKAARHMITFVPLTDDDTASWLSLFSRYPRLRMVVALSPRFKQFDKRPDLKARLDELIKAGRLEPALQLPNPPLLPLMVDRFPDDLLQLVARAKTDYYKTWKTFPAGFVVPYGAISPALVRQLERMGFSWAVVALGAMETDPVFRSGPLTLWDAAPSVDRVATLVRVWDDRTMPMENKLRKGLDAWAQELEKKTDIQVILPSDFTVPAGALPDYAVWKQKTWAASDWSAWVGSPAKDAAWAQLRKAREMLEKFKNSGQASVKRLDMAYEEYFQAANAGYFSAIGNASLPAATSEDREREFKATLASIYKIIGQNPPDNLFETVTPVSSSPSSLASTNGIVFEDPVGDDRGHAGPAFDLKRLGVVSSTSSLTLTVLFAATGEPRVDIYIDLNQMADAGTTTMLPGVGLGASGTDAWEFAVRLSSASATLFRTQPGGTFEPAGMFPVTMKESALTVSLPREVLRGSPTRWGYQVLTLSTGVADMLDPPGMTQAAFFDTVDSGIRSDVPFIRR